MEDRLCEGRVCIVTGAGRGIGREYALMLADHGAKVVVNDVGAARDGSGTDTGPAQELVDEIVAAGGKAVANTDDISTFDGGQSVVAQAVDHFGGLDVVVNNAGIVRDRMLFSMSEEEWDSVVQVHLKGTFATSRFAAEYWRDRSKAGETNDARIIKLRWILTNRPLPLRMGTLPREQSRTLRPTPWNLQHQGRGLK